MTKDKVYGWPMTALSPDGKTIYIAGTRRGSKPVPAVFKTTWDNRGDPEVFVGSESKPGSDESSLAEPRGVAVDGAGNVYVCDHMNDRVSVFSPEGKPLARIPAQYADLVSVHPKTGAVYVLCTKSNRKANPSNKWKLGRNFMAKKLLKFESYRAEKPVAQMVLPNSPAPPLMALDSSGEEAVLWLARLKWTPPGKGTVRRIVDKGKAFEDSGCPITEGLPKWAISTSHLDICADDFCDEVYVSEGVYVATPPGAKRFDGLTGKFLGEVVLKGDKDFLSKKVRASWGQPTFSWDGGTVLWNPPSEWVYRFGRDGNPAPWAGKNTHIVAGLPLGHIRARGLAAAPDGGFYILHQSGNRKTRESFASQVGPDGEVLRRQFIKMEAPVGGIRVDLKGNIYVGASVKPKGRDLPAGFGQQLPGTSTSGPKFYYAHAYGTLLKFGPEGGRVTAGAGDLELIPNRWKGKMTPARSEGVLWAYDGLSPIHSSIWSEELTCRCENPRFDVDRYGRVFVPDALRFSVAVLDTDGNPITRFGSYGNVDSRREGGGLNEPEIPLAWAHAVEVTEKMAYVADMVNHRIVAVKLTYAAEKTCAIR